MGGWATSGRHHVVIVGCGFGGLFAAKALRRANVDVTVIDRTNHHLFQPRLYPLATGILSAGDIAPPIRDVLRQQRNTLPRVVQSKSEARACPRRQHTPAGSRRTIAAALRCVSANGSRNSAHRRDRLKPERPASRLGNCATTRVVSAGLRLAECTACTRNNRPPGLICSSDRTIARYAAEMWDARPCPVP
jgi:glycine/D-amino acid oxidase-like deaminating enzyme